MSRWLVRAAAAVVIAAAIACSDDTTGVVLVDRVEVGPANQVMTVGDSTELTALALTEDGDIVAETILWRSLNTGVATLRVNGGTAVVSAKAAGTVRIEAEAGGRTGAVSVTVVVAVPVESVELQPTTIVIERDGQERSIRAVARAANGQEISGRAVTWTITSGNAVSITPQSNGFVNIRGEALGEAVIRASIGGVYAEAGVQVVGAVPPPATVASVIVSPSSFSLPIDHQTPLQAIAHDANGEMITGLPVTWSVTVDSVGTITPIGVSSFGSFVGRKPGTTKVRATVGGVTGEATIEVMGATEPPPQQILDLYFRAYQHALYVDQVLSFAEDLGATGANGPIENPAVVWEVLDSTIVSIDAEGNVRGLRAGRTRVRASSGSVDTEMFVTVFAPAGDVAVFNLTYDWWDWQWHVMPVIGTEQYTDENGVTYDVSLYATSGSLTLTSNGQYERVLRVEGWISDGLGGRRVVDREVIDRGTASIIIGGETGYWMRSTTTPGYEYKVVGWREPGHVRMRAALGTEPEQDYLFRMQL